MEAQLTERMVLDDFQEGVQFFLGMDIMGFGQANPKNADPNIIQIPLRRTCEILKREDHINVMWVKLTVEGMEEQPWANQHALLAAGCYRVGDADADN
jgi:hypothetical protein